MAHGHPKFQKGGGEIAAYSWFKFLQSQGLRAIFVGRGENADPYNTKVVLREIFKDEYVLYTSTDFFHFSTRDDSLLKALEVLIDAYKPDIIHLHHFVHIGLEVGALIKYLAPKTKLILTLHEYLAICHNNGQLLTTSGTVCSGYSPEKCCQCFPTISTNKFFMRELEIKARLSYFDYFICPSKFLFDIYLAWGLPGNKISVIENPFPSPALSFNAALTFPDLDQPLKIGFFGQINLYKGLDIIIEGVKQAIQNGRQVQLGIHGKMSAVTGNEYIKTLIESIRECRDSIVFYDAYESIETFDLMAQYHFVVMGSRWFENSPVVIQEALEANRPLIVPRLGGMLEKVNGIGLTFLPSNPTSLCGLLLGLTSEIYAELVINVQRKRMVLRDIRSDHQKALLNLYGVN